MEIIFPQFVSGIVTASVLFLATMGLSLIFGIAGVMNLAHVSLYMIGAYLTFSFWGLFQNYDFSYWIAVPLTCIAAGVIGFFLELIVIRHFYERRASDAMVATFALIFISGDVVKLGWGLQMKHLVRPAVLGKGFQLGSSSYPYHSIFVVGIAVIVFLAIWWWLRKSRTGRIVRAAQSNREMVAALGIPISRIYLGVFVLSVVIAGLAGSTWMCIGGAKLGMDIRLLVHVFCVMIIGGLGSFMGTAVAALIVGMIESFGILILPRFAIVFLFVVTAIVLVTRPHGLFGVKGREI